MKGAKPTYGGILASRRGKLTTPSVSVYGSCQYALGSRNKEPSKPGVEVKLLTVAIDIRRERESKSLQHCVLRYTGAKYRLWGEIPVKIPVRLSVPVPSPI